MLLIKLVLALLAVAVLGRAIVWMVSAELGRKSDLTRRIHRKPDSFNFAVLIPLLRTEDGPALGGLLRALLNQDYPTQQSEVYVLTHPDAQENLLALEQATRDRIHWWHGLEEETILSEESLLAWGVQRLIASGGQSRLFVFLNPGDIVREDFLTQVANRASYQTVMQAYLALKRLPVSIPARVHALAQRLHNRIEQAGRYHLGLSARLRKTGWVIHQEVLEKVPLQRFLTAFPAEYGMVLNRCGYRIHWSPNMVVYCDEASGFIAAVRENYQAFLQRLKLCARQVLPTLRFLVTQREWPQNIDHMWQCLHFSEALLGAIVLSLWLLAAVQVTSEYHFWGAFLLSYLALNFLSLFIARCSLQDMVFHFGIAPWFYAGLFLATPPIALYDLVVSLLSPRRPAFHQLRDGRQRVQPTNLNEKNNPQILGDELSLPTTDALSRLEQSIHGPAPTPLSVPLMGFLPAPLRDPQIILLTHGKTTIECRVVVHLAEPETIDGAPRYRLVLNHKGSSFETPPQATLEAAFDDLRLRLEQRGFRMQTCGTCAYYHLPETSQNEETRLMGLCLQGKEGVPEVAIHDEVHVLSPRCSHHESLEQRDEVLAMWRSSLSAHSVAANL